MVVLKKGKTREGELDEGEEKGGKEKVLKFTKDLGVVYRRKESCEREIGRGKWAEIGDKGGRSRGRRKRRRGDWGKLGVIEMVSG